MESPSTTTIQSPSSGLARYRLSINLFDLDRVPTALRQKMTPLLDLSKTVNVDLDRVESSVAVVFTCDLLTAALLLDFLRSESRRFKEAAIRGYLNRGGTSWSRLANHEVLTVLDGEAKAQLNPKIFLEKSAEEIVEGTPLPAEPLY